MSSVHRKHVLEDTTHHSIVTIVQTGACETRDSSQHDKIKPSGLQLTSPQMSWDSLDWVISV